VAIEQVTLEGLKQYLDSAKVTRGIQEVVLHHTWSPTAAQYRGKTTWDAIRKYHMEERGWSDIGYHFGVGPDRSIWKLRPVERSGAHVLNRNQHTVGVAMVGNFDVEDPMANGLPTAAQVVRVLVDRFELKLENVRFHREFQDKTCPGTKVDLGRFREMVGAAAATTKTVKLVDVATGEVVATHQLAPGGDHVADQGKVYVVRG
jgi:hypothetical protein